MDNLTEKLSQWIGSDKFWLTIILLVLMLLIKSYYRKARYFEQRFVQKTGSDADVGAEKYNSIGVNSYDSLRRAGSWLIIIAFLLVILAVNGLDVSAPLAGLGIAGTMVGLACQDVMKDTVMGFRIVVDGFYLVGDAVRINGIDGVVIDFNLRHTKLENLEDHSVLCICNGAITSMEKLSNLMIVELPFSEAEPLEKVKKSIQHMCSRIWMLDDVENCYYKGLEALRPDGAHYHLWVFTRAENQQELNYKVQAIVKEELEKDGLELASDAVEIENLPSMPEDADEISPVTDSADKIASVEGSALAKKLHQ